MSPSDLRDRISEEISHLPPMRTAVPEVLAEGARRRRRRHAVGAGIAAAAIIGAVAVGASVIGPGGGADQLPAPATNGADGLKTSTPTATPLRAIPATSDPEEFARWAAPRFSAALPDGYEDVRVLHRGGNVYDYVTHAPDGRTRVTFHLEMWSIPKDFPSLEGCAPGHRECAERPEIDAKAYLAEEELSANPNPPTRGYGELDMRPQAGPKNYDLMLEFTASQGIAVPLSPDEILDLAESPAFDAIWHEYAAHGEWVSAAELAFNGADAVYRPYDGPRSQR